MFRKTSLSAAALLAAMAAPAAAENVLPRPVQGSSSGSELPVYLECVPYAREASGITIYGDAHTWWDQAEGRFARGNRPSVGAVMALRPHGAMRLGHVAMVSKLVDRRTVLLRHANWSPINGVRGQIEENVRAVDVSPGNDWSEVRIWYAPQQDLGTTHWPVAGFIYPAKASAAEKRQLQKPAPLARTKVTRAETLRDPIGAAIGSF